MDCFAQVESLPRRLVIPLTEESGRTMLSSRWSSIVPCTYHESVLVYKDASCLTAYTCSTKANKLRHCDEVLISARASFPFMDDFNHCSPPALFVGACELKRLAFSCLRAWSASLEGKDLYLTPPTVLSD